jgi:hypothetical protein
VLVILLSLLLEQLHPPLQGLVLGAVLSGLLDLALGLAVQLLQLLDLLLEHVVLVLQGRDLLLLLQVLLLERLDLGLQLLDFGGGLVGFDAQGIHTLCAEYVSAWRGRRGVWWRWGGRGLNGGSKPALRGREGGGSPS